MFKESGFIEMISDPTEEELKALLGELDQDGNGKVERKEFKAFIMRILRLDST